MDKIQKEIRVQHDHIIVANVYMPEKEIRGHVHIFHGMAEHQERYEKFARFLNEHGYVVSTHDHRGHGQTASKNNAPYGFFAEEDGFEVVVQDAHDVIQAIRQEHDWPMPILIGHSMGSFILRRYIEFYSHEVKKVILMGTGAFSSLHRVGLYTARLLASQKGKTKPAKLLEQMSFGSYNAKVENSKTSSDWLSTDSREVRKYIEDDLCGFTCTNQFYVDLLTGLATLSKEAEVNRIRKDLPILLISGKEDPVGDYGKGVWRVARQYYHAGFTHVTVHLFEHKRHEILNEQNNTMVYKTILKWLEKKSHERATAV